MLRFFLLLFLWPLLLAPILTLKCLLTIFARPKRQLPRSKMTGVSILILNWNGVEVLKQNMPTVLRLMEKHCRKKWEVVVTDNGSKDESLAYLKSLKNRRLKIVALRSNYYFSGGNNRGLHHCRYSHILLLNNDMSPQNDFINPLIDGFSRDERTFAVSGQILFPATKKRTESGRTQILFMAKVHFQHDLDETKQFAATFWPGGGFTLFDKKKLLALGGFNEFYQPFYFEDTDLGICAWKRGWPSFYEPSSAALHLHRQSVGKLDPTHVEMVFETNRLKLLATRLVDFSTIWPILADVIFSDRQQTLKAVLTLYKSILPIFGDVIKNRGQEIFSVREIERFSKHLAYYKYHRASSWLKKRSIRPKILMVSAYPPVKSHGGGVRIFNHLKEISKGNDLTLITFKTQRLSASDKKFLKMTCQNFYLLETTPRKNFLGLPYYLSEFWNPKAKATILGNLDVVDFDAIDCEFTQMAFLLPRGLDKLKKITTEIDIVFISFLRRYWSLGMKLFILGFAEILKTYAFEKKYLKSFDIIVTVSEIDRQIIQTLLPEKPVMTIPNGVDIDFYQPQRRKKTVGLIFIGSWMHYPNRQAIEYFEDEIAPLIETPEAKHLSVMGDVPKEPNLDSKYIHYLGFVRDARTVYNKSRIFICPMRSGSGTRIKILEAMAMGIPVISTTVGAEGINCLPGREIIIADTPKSFARAIDNLYRADTLQETLRDNARKLVQARYSWKYVLSSYDKIYKN